MNDQLEDTATAVGAIPLSRRGRVVESFRLPQYRIFWAAMMFQMSSMNMQMVARAWLVYELTNSYTMLGVMALANAVPMLMLSLFGGVMADRVQKKVVLIAGQAASGTIAFGIALLIIFDIISLERSAGVGFLLVSGTFQGIVQGLMMPSRQAIIPEIVGPRLLMNAVALNNAGMNMNRLLAPAAAGLLIAILGIETVYLTMTALYIGGTFMVTRLRATGVISLGRGGALYDLREGIRYVRDNTLVMGLLVFTLLGVVLSMPYMHLLPAFAKDVQVVGEGQYLWVASIPIPGFSEIPELMTQSSFRLGLLTSISGIGALIGSLWIAAMGTRNRGVIYIGIVSFTGIALAAWAFSTSFGLALLMISAVGFAQSARMALSNGLVQNAVEDAYRGRVMSIYMMEFGLSSFTTFGVAMAANAVGVQWAVAGAALLLVPLGLFFLAFSRSIRRLQ